MFNYIQRRYCKMARTNIIIAGVAYQTKAAAAEGVRNKLNSIHRGGEIAVDSSNEADFQFLQELFSRHPCYDEITNGSTVETFHVMRNPYSKKTSHLEATLTDGRRTSISWLKCVNQRIQTKKSLVLSAMRSAIMNEILEFRKKNKTCKNCGSRSNIEIDHCGKKEFKDLANDFIDECSDLAFLKFAPSLFFTEFDTTDPETEEFMSVWQEYHKSGARLQPLCRICHSNKTYKRN